MRLRSIALFTLCACTVLSLWARPTACTGTRPERKMDPVGRPVRDHSVPTNGAEAGWRKVERHVFGWQPEGEPISGGKIHLHATSDYGTTSDVNATLKDALITGNAIETDPMTKIIRSSTPLRQRGWSAATWDATTARIHTAVFYRQFSPDQ